ncbi:hypothetical protein GCM10011608_25800 [Micromonospora sonchi]|uniref:Uncharacterized protein n=1 Tax=Micromonospora sonchi TaxID=1763543 RepID=A0A917WXQ0_9ACTN|nr:hypothetical protein GCM10011608_25800 [Micromonospora sonchi]
MGPDGDQGGDAEGHHEREQNDPPVSADQAQLADQVHQACLRVESTTPNKFTKTPKVDQSREAIKAGL